MTLTWAEQYRHPKWQMRRLERMKAANATCERCGETELTLNVHHKRYVRGRMVWEYADNELECLCEPCHEEQTHLDRDMRDLLFHVDKKRALAILAGFYCTTEGIEDLLERIAAENPYDFRIGVLAFISMLFPVDGRRRLAGVFIDCIGADQPEYVRREWGEVADKWLGPRGEADA